MVTDLKSLFDILVKETVTDERGLAIDLQLVRQAYAQQEISDIAFVCSEHNPAGSLTKGQQNPHLTEGDIAEQNRSSSWTVGIRKQGAGMVSVPSLLRSLKMSEYRS